MIRLRTILSLLVLALAFVALPTSACDKVWVFQQDSMEEGPLTLYVNDCGIKMVTLKGQGEIISHAPDWNVVLCNRRDKLAFHVPYERWCKLGITTIPEARWIPFQKKALKPVKYAGLACQLLSVATVIYRRDGSMAESGLNFRSQSGIERKHAGSQPVVLGYYCSDKVPALNNKALQVLRGCYKIPAFGVVPLCVRFNMKNGQSVCTLSTVKVTEQPVPPHLFDDPVGYKPARTPEHALAGNEADEFVKDLLDGK